MRGEGVAEEDEGVAEEEEGEDAADDPSMLYSHFEEDWLKTVPVSETIPDPNNDTDDTEPVSSSLGGTTAATGQVPLIMEVAIFLSGDTPSPQIVSFFSFFNF